MEPLEVSAIGMATSLGLNAEDACAAARAGLVRLTPVEVLNTSIDPRMAKEDMDGVPPFVAHVAPIVGGGYTAAAKLLALCKPALGDLLERAALSRGALSRTALLMTVSDGYFPATFGDPPEGVDENDPVPYHQRWTRTVSSLPDRVRVAFNLPLGRDRIRVIPGGRVGMIRLLREAEALMTDGIVDRCIVGGVESCVEPVALTSYAAAGVVKCATNPVGFLPGEAAAFFLTEKGMTATGTTRLRVTGIGYASDAALTDDAAPTGRGISAAIGGALQNDRSDGGFPGLVITDLNGTERRAFDWGCALMLLRATFGDCAFQTWIPAQSFGETGAAAGPLAICLAYRAAERDYLPSPKTLVTLGADDGGRAAILLHTRT